MSVQIRSCRSGRSRGVGNDHGIDRVDADGLFFQTEFPARHGFHFIVQPLTHFHTALVDGHGPVFVQVDKGCSLVQEGSGVRNTKFDGHQRQTSFGKFIYPVEIGSCLLSLFVIGGCKQLIQNGFQHVFFHNLPVRRNVSALFCVEISLSYQSRVQLQGSCHLFHNMLNYGNGLRGTKTPEGCIGSFVCFAGVDVRLDGRM